jgi:hypothetical protein
VEFHEIANVFPLMQGEDYDQLVADIRAHGLLHTITLYEDKILEGRNRYRACQDAGVTPDYIEFTGDDPLQFVWSENVVRRHLTAGQRVMAAAAFLPLLEAQAKERMLAGKSADPVLNSTQGPDQAPPAKKHHSRTRQVAAKMAGVGVSTMGEGITLARAASNGSTRAQKLADEVASGARSIHSAVSELNGTAPLSHSNGAAPDDTPAPPIDLADSIRLVQSVRILGQHIGGIRHDFERGNLPLVTTDAFSDWWDEVDTNEWTQTLAAAKWFAVNGQPMVEWILARAKRKNGNTPPRVIAKVTNITKKRTRKTAANG